MQRDMLRHTRRVLHTSRVKQRRERLAAVHLKGLCKVPELCRELNVDAMLINLIWNIVE